MTNHKFDRYLARHGHYPRFRRRGVTVEVAPSYVTIRKHGRDHYVPRPVLIALVKWLVPLISQMEGDFDPDEAMKDYLENEAVIERELRQQKKHRRPERYRGLRREPPP